MKPLLLVLILYLLIKGIENIVALVNLHHLSVYGHRVPAGFEGHVDEQTLTRMRDYTLQNGKVDLLSSGVDVVITVIFIFGGLLDWYNSLISGRDWSPLFSGILFFLALFYGEFLLQIPFDLYKTFHIEEKFNFNRQTVGLWLSDALKGLFLTTLIYGLLLTVCFWLIEAMPAYWWLFIWGFLLFFKIFLLYISPYVIEPLFNKFTPIADEHLEKRIKELLARAGLSVSRVFTMDASRRSGHGNAYFGGIGHVKRIVLFDTLLENNSHEEILAILAHEAGHWKKKHILKRLVVMECILFGAIYLSWWLMQGDQLTTLFRISEPTVYVKLLLIGFCGMLVSFPFKPLSAYLSRKHEWEADRFGAELTGTPRALARALVKLGRDNLSNLHPHPWYIAFYYSHPPLSQRVAKLLKR